MLTHAPMPVFNAFAPAGRGFTYATIPGALPRAVCSLGFQPAYGNDGVSLQISENPKLYAVFQIPEGGILRSKRPPFSLQYAAFWSAKGGLLHSKRYHLDFQYVTNGHENAVQIPAMRCIFALRYSLKASSPSTSMSS